MTPKTITFRLTENGHTAIFSTKHGRKILMTIRNKNNHYKITECRYIDRNGYTVPKKLVCTKIPYNLLGLLLYEQLDTEYDNLEFVNEPVTSVAAMIAEAAENIRPKILILLRNGNCIHTMFKNRFRRTIYLEISLNAEKANIIACHYADKKDGGKHKIPHSLTNLECESGIDEILAFVNDELDGGFTNILLASEYDITLDQPIYGTM